MCHFLNQRRKLAKKKVTALIFCMVVAFMTFIKELLRNSGGTAVTAENRNLPTNLNHLRQSYQKNILLFALNTHYFWLKVKYYKCQMQ